MFCSEWEQNRIRLFNKILISGKNEWLEKDNVSSDDFSERRQSQTRRSVIFPL